MEIKPKKVEPKITNWVQRIGKGEITNASDYVIGCAPEKTEELSEEDANAQEVAEVRSAILIHQNGVEDKLVSKDESRESMVVNVDVSVVVQPDELIHQVLVLVSST